MGCKFHCCFTAATFTLATCVKPSLDRVIATSCREQRNTSREVAAVTVKLTLRVPGRNMVLRSNLYEVSPQNGAQRVKVETSCVGSAPRRGHASACRDAGCETSAQQCRHTCTHAHTQPHIELYKMNRNSPTNLLSNTLG